MTHTTGQTDAFEHHGEELFTALFEEVMATSPRFGHRQHLHLTWLAVHRRGTHDAIHLVSTGIQRTARYAGAPQKYHATISRAWVELIGHHAAGNADTDFHHFIARFPELLDKTLLTRHYRSTTLASTQARTDWIEPDLTPFPCHDKRETCSAKPRI